MKIIMNTFQKPWAAGEPGSEDHTAAIVKKIIPMQLLPPSINVAVHSFDTVITGHEVTLVALLPLLPQESILLQWLPLPEKVPLGLFFLVPKAESAVSDGQSHAHIFGARETGKSVILDFLFYRK